MHIIILNKDQIALQITIFAQMDDMLDVAFAVVVARARVTGKNELHWSLPIAGQFHNTVELLKDERSAFVSGEPPRKTDSQRIGIQQLIKRNEVALPEALSLQQQSAACEL